MIWKRGENEPYKYLGKSAQGRENSKWKDWGEWTMKTWGWSKKREAYYKIGSTRHGRVSTRVWGKSCCLAIKVCPSASSIRSLSVRIFTLPRPPQGDPTHMKVWKALVWSYLGIIKTLALNLKEKESHWMSKRITWWDIHFRELLWLLFCN